MKRFFVLIALFYAVLLIAAFLTSRSRAQMAPIATGENGQAFSGRTLGGMASGIAGGGVDSQGRAEREATGGSGRKSLAATATPTPVPSATPT